MKNIYIIDEYISSQKNGIGTFLRELLFCIVNDVNNINIISFNAEQEEFEIVEEKGIRKFFFPMFGNGNFMEHHKITEKFFKLYIQDSYDNIFFINHSPCASFIESLKNTLPKSKIVFTIHDFGWTGLMFGDLEKYKNEINQYKSNKSKANNSNAVKVYNQEKRIYQLSDKIVCLSKDSYDILKSVYHVDENKISLISNCLREKESYLFNRKSLRSKRRISDNEKILLFIGRPTKQKGLYDLLASLSMVLEENRNVKLVIVGDSNEVSMKDIVNASFKLAPSIVLTGQVDHEEVEEWLTIADIGIISSYYEQCSYTAIEMMMHGLPIIASDGLGIRNMFTDTLNAKVAKIGDINNTQAYHLNLTTAIIELLDSPELCNTLGKTARMTYVENYQISFMRQKYNELIDKL